MIKIESPETHERQLPNKAASPKNTQARTRKHTRQTRERKTPKDPAKSNARCHAQKQRHTHTDAGERAKCRICLRCGTQPAVGDEERRRRRRNTRGRGAFSRQVETNCAVDCTEPPVSAFKERTSTGKARRGCELMKTPRLPHLSHTPASSQTWL